MAMLLAALPGAAAAQLLPGLPAPVGGAVDRLTRALPVEPALRGAERLARDAAARARDLARRYPDRIELDRGQPVRRGEVTLLDPDPATLALAQGAGFVVLERERFDELGLGFARLRVPGGLSAADGVRRLSRIVGAGRVSSDPLHVASGSGGSAAMPPAPAPPPAASRRAIGIIDGGVAPATPGLAAQQGFAAGAPRARDHATAIASLLTGGGGIRPSAPGAALHVADVYGSDPAGGSATAIARALAWMVRARVPVVVVSLAGPPNPLLGRVVAAARTHGTIVVAAVGNDGPAAPPAYPASYPQAIAVTGVDGRGRALIEAGRATHLDYAAPGADMLALGSDGRPRGVRGTSFAAPLVAARLSAVLDGDATAALATLNREARRGAARTGRGVLCGDCRTVR